MAQVAISPRAQAGEEAFRPVPKVTTTASASSLKWHSRGSSGKMPVRQAGGHATDGFTEAKVATPASAIEPVAVDKAPAGFVEQPEKSVKASRFSSKQSRSRVRDSVMQVNAYQDPEAPSFDDNFPATTPPLNQNELPDPYETEAPLPPAGSPRNASPPAMPNEDPPPFAPAQDLFKDDPIPNVAPHQPAELPESEDRQLLDNMGTEPGGVGCEGQKSECQDAIRKLQKRDITTITVGLLIEGVEGTDFPCDCRLGRDYDAPQFAGRDFAPTLFTWKAAGTCHKPLYFEDVQLERYGHSWNPIIQPFMSGAHFFVSVPLLPYKMGLRPPNECVYTLGYYRPGSCAPYMFEPIPLSFRGAVAEGFGAAALAFWFWPPH